MTSENPREASPFFPLRDGEFRRISGIGPGIEQRLRVAGIKTFDHLASLSPDEILEALNGLIGITTERISRQDWAGQARAFADQLLQSEPAEAPEPESFERQYYQSFKIVLLMDMDNQVRSTRVIHVQNDQQESWAGWDPQRMTGWIEDQANIPQAEEPAEEPLPPALNERPPAAVPANGNTPAGHVPPAVSGSLAIKAVQILDPHTGQPHSFFTAGQPFVLSLMLDLAHIEALDAGPLGYQVWVNLNQLGGQKHPHLIESQGDCTPGGPLRIPLTIPGLEMGAYRVSAGILLYPAASPTPERSGVQAFSEGVLVQIHSNETEPARL